MPPNYIGSSYSDKVENKKYHGTVVSKKWKQIWNEEIKNNPQLFNTEILIRFTNRQEATNFEELIQRKLNVVRSDLYINESYANKGFSHNTSHTELSKKKMSDIKKGKKMSTKTKKKMSQAHLGKSKSEEHKENIRKARLGTTRLESTKYKISEMKKGIKWVKKNDKSKTIYPHEFEEYLNLGWVFGRTINRRNK